MVPPGVVVRPTLPTAAVVLPARRSARALQGQPPSVRTASPGPISRQALTRSVPAAPFRGPRAERTIQAVDPAVHQRGVQQLTGWVRQQNSRPVTSSGRWTHDVIGNTIPSGTTIISSSSLTQINVNFVNVVNVFGEPRHDFLFLPRTSFFAGFFDTDDGFFEFGRHRHHSFIAVSLFYPFYFSEPYWNAFNYPGFYPSVYSMWGWSPGWVYPDRVYYAPTDYVYAPAPYRPGYRLDVGGQQRAIADVRQAWAQDDPSLFAAHLTDSIDVRIYFNGAYSYSTTMNDYYAMTADTMSTTQTTAIDFGDPIWVSSNEVFYTGSQVFTDPDGTQRTLYISYRFRKLGSDWYVVAFGSSDSPIQSEYRDFRYR
jgi:hypothetical protein